MSVAETAEELRAEEKRANAEIALAMHNDALEKFVARFGAPPPVIVRDNEDHTPVRLLDIVLSIQEALVTFVVLEGDDPLAPWTFCQSLADVLTLFEPMPDTPVGPPWAGPQGQVGTAV